MPGGPEALIERCQVRKFTAEEIRKLKAKETGAPAVAHVATRNFPSNRTHTTVSTNKRKPITVPTELEQLNDGLTPGEEYAGAKRRRRPNPDYQVYQCDCDGDDEEELPTGNVKVEVKTEQE